MGPLIAGRAVLRVTPNGATRRPDSIAVEEPLEGVAARGLPADRGRPDDPHGWSRAWLRCGSTEVIPIECGLAEVDYGQHALEDYR
jgi:hypothetical protein